MFNGTIIGNVTKDAIIKDANGSKVANFTLACRGHKKNTSTGEYETEFIDCNIWGKRGESVAQYIKKGMGMTALGQLSIRRFEYNGEKRAAVNMDVTDFNFNTRPAGEKASAPSAQAAPTPVDNPDDLPF